MVTDANEQWNTRKTFRIYTFYVCSASHWFWPVCLFSLHATPSLNLLFWCSANTCSRDVWFEFNNHSSVIHIIAHSSCGFFMFCSSMCGNKLLSQAISCGSALRRGIFMLFNIERWSSHVFTIHTNPEFMWMHYILSPQAAAGPPDSCDFIPAYFIDSNIPFVF